MAESTAKRRSYDIESLIGGGKDDRERRLEERSSPDPTRPILGKIHTRITMILPCIFKRYTVGSAQIGTHFRPACSWYLSVLT
jgi:hypothetical protein